MQLCKTEEAKTAGGLSEGAEESIRQGERRRGTERARDHGQVERGRKRARMELARGERGIACKQKKPHVHMVPLKPAHFKIKGEKAKKKKKTQSMSWVPKAIFWAAAKSRQSPYLPLSLSSLTLG